MTLRLKVAGHLDDYLKRRSSRLEGQAAASWPSHRIPLALAASLASALYTSPRVSVARILNPTSAPASGPAT